MNRLSALTHNAPGLDGPPDEDDRVERRAEDLAEEWEQDPLKLAEAAEEVLGFTSYCDHMAQDVASAMVGHADDQGARDLRFMADLRRRVSEQLAAMAMAQAKEESQGWISWREAQRQRARRHA
jgi:hypothetical protein